MNFLAHSLFAADDPEQVVGQFCGDFVRGGDLSEFSPGIERGIRLHRQIDAFTDQHADVRSCRKLFDPPLRRFAGIIIDVVFDHFIARDWQPYHAASLDAHIEYVHASLMDYHSVLPVRLQRFVNYMQREEVLAGYRYWQGVDLSFRRIAQRSSRFAPIANALPHAQRHEAALLEHFAAFFPELAGHVQMLQITHRETA